VYASLAALLSAKRERFGDRLTMRAVEALNKCLAALPQSVVQAKLLVRFMGCLAVVGVADPNTFASLLRDLVKQSAEGGNEVYLYLALSALPWCGKMLQQSCGDDLAALLDSAADIMKARKPILPISPMGISGDEPQDELGHVWQVVESLGENWWEVKAAWSPHEHFQDVNEGGKSHEILTDEVKYGEIATTSFGIFANVVSESDHDHVTSIPKMAIAEKYVWNQYFADMLAVFQPDHLECAKKIVAFANVIPITVDCAAPLLILNVRRIVFICSNVITLIVDCHVGVLFSIVFVAGSKAYGNLFLLRSHRYHQGEPEVCERFGDYGPLHV